MGLAAFGSIIMPVTGWILLRTAKHDTEIAVLKATVPEYGSRIQVVEGIAAEVRGDMREVKVEVHRIAGWVDKQSDPSRQRRSTDMEGEPT